ASHLRRSVRIDTQPEQALLVRYWRDHEAPIPESHETAVEEKVRLGREHQSVVATDAFTVGRVPPRLDVAGDEVDWIGHARDAASMLDPGNVLSEYALTPTR